MRESKEPKEIRPREKSITQRGLGRDEGIKVVRHELIWSVRLYSLTPGLFQKDVLPSRTSLKQSPKFLVDGMTNPQSMGRTEHILPK